MLIKIQSFGDVITNSSSEVYCMFDIRGTTQVKEAIKSICEALNPDINIDEHIEIELVPSPYAEIYDSESGDYKSLEDYYTECYNKWCEDKSNEQILLDFPEWYDCFMRDTLFQDVDGYEEGKPNYELEIRPLTDTGERLKDAIFKILYAYDYKEIYDG